MHTMVLQNNVNALLKMLYSCVNEISRLLSLYKLSETLLLLHHNLQYFKEMCNI